MGQLYATQFGCVVERGACTAWVELTGELDLATAPVLRQRLRKALDHAILVVLDLRQLTFIDAAGLHVICDASERAGEDDRRLMLLRGPARVDRVFTLTGLNEKLAMFDVASQEGNLVPAQTGDVALRAGRAGDRGERTAPRNWPASRNSTTRTTESAAPLTTQHNPPYLLQQQKWGQ